MWDISRNPGDQLVRTLHGHNDAVTSVAALDSGMIIASGDDAAQVQLHCLDKNMILLEIPEENQEKAKKTFPIMRNVS